MGFNLAFKGLTLCQWCLLAIYILVLKRLIEMAQKSINQLLKRMLNCIVNLLLIEFTKTVQMRSSMFNAQ